MKQLLALSLLILVSCAGVPRDAKKVPTLAAVTDPIHFRTAKADIAMAFSDVEKALRESNFAPDVRERSVRLLRERKSQAYFTQAWPDDEVGYAIHEVVLPALLEQGRVVVTDIKSKRPAEFIYATWAPRGEIGPSFLLPDKREFFRQVLFVE